MKLYVGNLSKETTDEQLNAVALQFGTMKSSTVARERAGASKGFGFIEFMTADAAKAAIAGLDGPELGGRTIKVSAAKSQTPKDPLGGRY